MGTFLFVLGVLMFFGIVAFLLFLVSIPILVAVAILFMVLRLAFFLVTMPFRVVGWMFGMAFGRQAS